MLEEVIDDHTRNPQLTEEARDARVHLLTGGPGDVSERWNRVPLVPERRAPLPLLYPFPIPLLDLHYPPAQVQDGNFGKIFKFGLVRSIPMVP